MSTRKDGPDAVGSYLAGPALTIPQIAPALNMFANSRVEGHGALTNITSIDGRPTLKYHLIHEVEHVPKLL
jgi:hypothetical protein